MTREDLIDWLKSEGCQQAPLHGINVTANAIKIYNPKTGRSTYIETPIDDRQIPDFAVAHICEQLLVKSPDCATDQIHLVKKLKDRFTNKPIANKANSKKKN